MIFDDFILSDSVGGYIAGTGAGIVTVKGQPVAKDITLYDAVTMLAVYYTSSLNSGHYIFLGIPANKEYLVMVRDNKREFEPFCWDYVKPATDIDQLAQKALWASWQTT